MDRLAQGYLECEDLSVTERPVFRLDGFSVWARSQHNPTLGIEIMDRVLELRGEPHLAVGARKQARRLARKRGKHVPDTFLYVGFARKGWMVPNRKGRPACFHPW
jgi:glyceraldehyde-3-phosphate dehydrogenase (ferredoxin)